MDWKHSCRIQSTMTSIQSGNRYFIVNKKSGTVVDLDIRDNKSVISWARHGGVNQQVKILLTVV